MNRIEARDICKSYVRRGTKLLVLDQINFLAKSGEFVAIEGESGCGKTTFLSILAGILPADEGSVRYFDSRNELELSKLKPTEKSVLRRRDIVLLPQLQSVIAELTVAENILLPAMFSGQKREQVDKHLDFLINRLGLKDLADCYPDEISGGELRRLAVARACILQPKIILADEPTNDLDRENRLVIYDFFREMADAGSIVIVATHDKELAESADRRININTKTGGII